MPRTGFVAYTADGVDVGCNYSLGPEADAIFSTYFTRRTDAPLESSVDVMKEEISSTYGDPEMTADDEIARSDGLAVRRVVYEKGTTRLLLDYSAGWLSDIGGWTSKVRISWAAGLDRPFVDRLADSLSLESTRNVWTADCAPVTERAGESAEAAAGAIGAIVALAAVHSPAPGRATRVSSLRPMRAGPARSKRLKATS